MLEATVIHARPADVLKRQPFVPKKEPAKTTGKIGHGKLHPGGRSSKSFISFPIYIFFIPNQLHVTSA